MTVPEVGGSGLIDALRAVQRPARLERECLAARILEDLEADGVVCYIEEWASNESVARRVGSDPFRQLLGLMEASLRPPTLEFRFVSEVRGLDYVEAVRERLTPRQDNTQE